MLLKRFFPIHFISFYSIHHKYYLLHEVIKNDKIIDSSKEEFEDKSKLKKYIKNIINDYPQTYVSTILLNIDQGVVNSCSKQVYKEKNIEINNIKIVCINNKYSFYTSIYELSELKKEFEIIDFIYPIFAVIDFLAKDKNNSLYILNIDNFFATIVYKDNIALYSEIFNEETEVEDISDMDIDEFDEFDDDLGELDEIEDIENIDEVEEEKEDISHLDTENKIFTHIKESIKNYYNEGGDFLEKIYIISTKEINNSILNLIEDELFMKSEIINIDLLETINDISKKNV